MAISTSHVFDANLADERVYAAGPDEAFVGTVTDGDAFTLRTLDASGNQMREGVRPQDIRPDALFPVTGPVEIAGARAGDTIGLTILDLRTAAHAHSWTRPGIGIGPELGYQVRRIDLAAAHWPGQPDIGLDIRPHVGTLGLLPAVRHEARDLGAYAGNIDMHELGAGATLWVRAQVDGGGVFAGDIHAGIGDGEICGTGLEAAGEVDLKVQIRRYWSPELPIVTRNGRAWMIGVDSTVEGALVKAVEAIVPLLSAHLEVPAPEAYLILAQLLELKVCQVVNPHVSVSVSLGQGLDACFGAPDVGRGRQTNESRGARS